MRERDCAASSFWQQGHVSYDTQRLPWRRFPSAGKCYRRRVMKEVPFAISPLLDHEAEQPSLKSNGARITRLIYCPNDEVRQMQAVQVGPNSQKNCNRTSPQRGAVRKAAGISVVDQPPRRLARHSHEFGANYSHGIRSACVYECLTSRVHEGKHNQRCSDECSSQKNTVNH